MKKEYEKESDLVGATSDMFSKPLRFQSAADVDIETFDDSVINYHYLRLYLGNLLKVKLMTLEKSSKANQVH